MDSYSVPIGLNCSYKRHGGYISKYFRITSYCKSLEHLCQGCLQGEIILSCTCRPCQSWRIYSQLSSNSSSLPCASTLPSFSTIILSARLKGGFSVRNRIGYHSPQTQGMYFKRPGNKRDGIHADVRSPLKSFKQIAEIGSGYGPFKCEPDKMLSSGYLS